MIPTSMAGDDAIPTVGTSGCHRQHWPIMYTARLCGLDPVDIHPAFHQAVVEKIGEAKYPAPDSPDEGSRITFRRQFDA